jgi:Type III restriction enzyme, res subunit
MRSGATWEHIRGANEQANPELVRLAMKMATGSGKTTVMAMLIAWHTLNAVRHPNSRNAAAEPFDAKMPCWRPAFATGRDLLL